MQYYDVLLINPPWSKLGDALENLGLGYIAAYMKRNEISVRILDAPLYGWDANKAIEEILKLDCKLIGVSIPYQEAAEEILSFISEIKKAKPDVHLTIGGIYPTFAYEELLTLFPAIDSVVVGEGEETATELASVIIYGGDIGNVKGIAYRAQAGIIKTEPRPSVENLDTLPFPARDTIEQNLRVHNFATLITSRGCYARCSFCSVVPYYSAFGQQYRMRSAENVLEEIELLYNKYGVRNIMINDANFIGGSTNARERARKIAEGILDRKLDLEIRIQCRVNDVEEELFALLKKAGLTRVYLGIESGSQAVLDRFKKDATVQQNIDALKVLAKLDLFVAMGFIMFDDRMNFNELNENINFLNQVKKIIPKDKLGSIYPLSKLLPLAGTEAERYMKANKKYKGNSLAYSYSFDDVTINMFYNFCSTLSKVVLSLMKLVKPKSNSDKTWVGGWRETVCNIEVKS